MNQINAVTDKAATYVYMSQVKIDCAHEFVRTYFSLQNDSNLKCKYNELIDFSLKQIKPSCEVHN